MLTPAEKPCPACGERDVRRSHRRGAERAVGFFLPLRPYRCTSCYRRLWGLRRPIFNSGFTLLLGMGLLGAALVGLDAVRAARQAHEPGHGVAKLPPPAEPDPGARALPLVGNPAHEPERPAAEAPPTVVAPPESGSDPTPPAVAAAGRRLQTEPPAEGPEPVEPSPPAAVVSLTEKLSAAAARRGARRLEMRGLRLSSHEDRLSIELEASAPVIDYRQTRAEDPERWVFDLPGEWVAQPTQEIVAAHPLVDTVRVGHHSDKLRLVVDLGPTPSALPEVRSSPRGLTITLRRARLPA